MFYNNLMEECTRQGLKVTPIVKECGGASGPISSWKKGAMPNSEIVIKLSMRLNVSCDFLLTGRKIENAASCSLKENEQELLNLYGKLDSRGRHRLHTIAYEELDRIDYEAHKVEHEKSKTG